MITKADFQEEERRLKRLHKDGWTKDGPSDKNTSGWLRGWRLVASQLDLRGK